VEYFLYLPASYRPLMVSNLTLVFTKSLHLMINNPPTLPYKAIEDSC